MFTATLTMPGLFLGDDVMYDPYCFRRPQLFHWAQRNAEYIVPLYCFDPRHYVGTHNYNLPKTGPFRLRFLLDSVRDLRNTLLNKGR